jgi:hypothetical protein
MGLIPLGFELIESSDQAQHASGGLRPLRRRLEEAPSGVGPATGPFDAEMRADIGGIPLVAVRLEHAAIVT